MQPVLGRALERALERTAGPEAAEGVALDLTA